jgi:hypothetical protein
MLGEEELQRLDEKILGYKELDKKPIDVIKSAIKDRTAILQQMEQDISVFEGNMLHHQQKVKHLDSKLKQLEYEYKSREETTSNMEQSIKDIQAQISKYESDILEQNEAIEQLHDIKTFELELLDNTSPKWCENTFNLIKYNLVSVLSKNIGKFKSINNSMMIDNNKGRYITDAYGHNRRLEKEYPIDIIHQKICCHLSGNYMGSYSTHLFNCNKCTYQHSGYFRATDNNNNRIDFYSADDSRYKEYEKQASEWLKKDYKKVLTGLKGYNTKTKESFSFFTNKELLDIIDKVEYTEFLNLFLNCELFDISHYSPYEFIQLVFFIGSNGNNLLDYQN